MRLLFIVVYDVPSFRWTRHGWSNTFCVLTIAPIDGWGPQQRTTHARVRLICKLLLSENCAPPMRHQHLFLVTLERLSHTPWDLLTDLMPPIYLAHPCLICWIFGPGGEKADWVGYQLIAIWQIYIINVIRIFFLNMSRVLTEEAIVEFGGKKA